MQPLLRFLENADRLLSRRDFARIAQRFNVGIAARWARSPEGTTEPHPECQSSLRDFNPLTITVPTLKRWAILGHPSGMKEIRTNQLWHFEKAAQNRISILEPFNVLRTPHPDIRYTWGIVRTYQLR